MQKYYNIPLLFFFLAATLGLFLRWQFVSPTPGIRYTYVLHAHSHVMFLGWVLNALYLTFVDHHIAPNEHPFYIKFFWLLQILTVAMMISFPIQGYGAFSIIFSTVHTLAFIVFIILFFRKTHGQRTISLWFARVALIFFFISTAGPFSLGYLMSNNLGQTVWYNFSIYYYLHFQYNGFFLFGILSLFFQLLERKNIAVDYSACQHAGMWMAVACVPTYFLSTLFAKPGWLFNVTGAAAAIVQLAGVALLIKQVYTIRPAIHVDFDPTVRKLLALVLFTLVVKCILQLASAHPEIAEMAYHMRPVVIAYLHLVLVGIITLFLLAWYIEMNFVDLSYARFSIGLLLTGYAGSEVCLVLAPWWSKVAGLAIGSASLIFAFSILLVAGSFVFYWSFLRKQTRLMLP